MGFKAEFIRRRNSICRKKGASEGLASRCRAEGVVAKAAVKVEKVEILGPSIQGKN